MGTCAGSGSSSRKQPSRKCKLKRKHTIWIEEEEHHLDGLSDMSFDFTDNEQKDELLATSTIRQGGSTLGTQSSSKTRKTVQ